LVLDYCLDEPALVAEVVVELALARSRVGHYLVQARRDGPRSPTVCVSSRVR
jgi:hypothetical protein